MEWSTVIVSVSLSAIVGTLVSLAAVSQPTVRQRRAERRDDARLQLAAAVAPFRADVRKYQGRLLASLRREGAGIDGTDYQLASRVLAAAQKLGPVRRFLVSRRCRRLFGAVVYATAELSPMRETGQLGDIVPLLMVQYDPSKAGLGSESDRLGEIHSALRSDPGSVELKRLERSLARLSAGW